MGIKPEAQQKNEQGSHQSSKGTLLNNPGTEEQVSREMKKNFKLNENKNPKYQNLEDPAKHERENKGTKNIQILVSIVYAPVSRTEKSKSKIN